MTAVQTVATPKVEWDDSVVFVFSFPNPAADAGTPSLFCGFVHMQVQLAVSQGVVQTAAGSLAQVNNIIQLQTTAQVQVAADPQSWLDTVRTAARGTSANITITYDDTITTIYTTQVPPTASFPTSFTLQQLFSLAG